MIGKRRLGSRGASNAIGEPFSPSLGDGLQYAFSGYVRSASSTGI